MSILQTCPSHLSHVATLPWEIQKSRFSTLLFTYFKLFTLPQKKTNSICCTAALAVYLLLFSASYYLHSHSTASGACYRRSMCIDMDMLRFAAAVCCDMGWMQGSFPVRKRTGTLRIWRARGREPIWGSGDGAASGVQGQSPWSGGQGAKPPLKLKAFYCRRKQICHSHLSET